MCYSQNYFIIKLNSIIPHGRIMRGGRSAWGEKCLDQNRSSSSINQLLSQLASYSQLCTLYLHLCTEDNIQYLFMRPAGSSQVAPVVKNLPANAGDIRDSGSIPGSGRSPGGGYRNPLQYSCLKNPMDRAA